MDKLKFLSSTIRDISQVYFGKRDCCRCGCGGDYKATSFMINPRGEVNDELVEERLKRAQHLVEKGADVDYGDNYVDVQTGRNRTLTFYFDEVRER